MDMDPTVLLAQFDAHPPPSPAAAVNPFLAGAVAANTQPHPSYVDMITAAIEWENSQGKESGSSKRAIAKYIDRVYTNLPATHSALLTHHLQRLKNSGQLVMLKNSYQLPSALPPPSPWPQPARSDAATDFSGSVEPTSAKRGRGRPPKQKVAVDMEFGPDPDMGIDNGSGSGSGSEQVKKQRGRPPRWTQEGAVATEVPFVQLNEETPVKRQRGRPPKNASALVVMPERSEAEGSVRSRGRPRKNVLGPVVSTRPVGNRPRGRPKMLGRAVSGVGVGMGMRHGRGRPPKGSGPPMGRRRAGRPPGSAQVKKQRGSPPRWTQEDAVATEVPFVQLISEVSPISTANGDASSGWQKRRGRPPQVQTMEAEPVPFAPEKVYVNEETSVKRQRGRGRPPKQKVAVELEFGSDPDMGIDNGSGSGSGSEQVKKQRGRPPRWTQDDAVATEVSFVQLIPEVSPISIANGHASSGGQKRRGRPPKVQAMEVEPMPFAPEEDTSVKRQRGRPPTNASSVAVMPERPDAEGSVRSRGRPRKNVLGPVVSTRPVGNRPRGRPKMMGGVVSGGADLGVGFRMGMRRGRGRPPKGGGPLMGRRRAGRLPGRPRKDDSILRNCHTAGQEVADEELLRKLELIQSKIREAVIVIRPCVADESPALMALQQLEELATMDVPVLHDPPPSPPETPTIPQSDIGGSPTSAII